MKKPTDLETICLLNSNQYKTSNTVTNLNQIENSDILNAVINGDTNFFLANSSNKKRILKFQFMSGNCFHFALQQAQKDICLILVNLYGFDPTKCCKIGKSPLHWLLSTSLFINQYETNKKKETLKSNFISLLDFLRLKNVDLNSVDENGMTALHYAAIQNNDIGAEKLLNLWDTKLDILDKNNETPLHLSIRYENFKVFKSLIKSEKLRIDHLINTNEYDYLPIHYACKLSLDNTHIVDLLIQKVIEYKLNKKLKNNFNYNIRVEFVKKFTPIFQELNKNKLDVLNDIEKILYEFYTTTKTVQVLNKIEIFNLINETWLYLQDNLLNVKSKQCGQRPLNLAVKANNLQICELLFKYGANCNLYSSGKHLPIHYVALNCLDNTNMLDLMISLNSISLKHNDKMENIFHLCAMSNNYKFLLKTLDYLNQKEIDSKLITKAIDSIDSNQFTPLFVAIAASASLSNSIDLEQSQNDTQFLCTKIFIENEYVNKYHMDSHFNNMFHVCALYNNYKVLNYLIINRADLKHLFYATNSSLNTVLHIIAMKNNCLILKQIYSLIRVDLVQDVVGLFKKKNLLGDSFFQTACKHGSLDIVKLVLNNPIENYYPIRDLDSSSNSPLLNAIIYNQFEIVSYLILNNYCSLADINAENVFGQLALHLSCKYGSLEISELLIRYGSFLNVNDRFNANPLVYACENGNSQLVEYLLTLDSDHLRDSSLINIECLKSAIKSNNNKIVEILIENKNWQQLFKTSNQSELETSLAKLIEKMPNNMERLLDKLYDKQTQKYDFTLLDQPITTSIENHPLNQIAESNDERLLTHHTIQTLIKLKFKNLPRIAFLIDLFLYILYSFFISFYHLINQVEIKDQTNSTNETQTIYFLFDSNFRVNSALYDLVLAILIILISIHLSKEAFQLINYKPINYFSSVDNWFQLSTLFLAILSVIPSMDSSFKIAFGSFSILFAWISMSLFFQDLQLFSLGRYIVAFRKTIQNSFKFMPFFSMICIGFFFAFKIGEKFNFDESKLVYASNSSSNFLRIITMMIGDIEMPGFDEIDNDENSENNNFVSLFKLKNVYNTLIFLFFVFLMCIIILSLFEGIAVGEIKIVLDKAHVEIIASSIVYVLNIQMMSYYVYRVVLKNLLRRKKFKEPEFMTFRIHKFNRDNSDLIGKKSTESIKNIDSNCNQMLIKLNYLNRKVDEQINQMKLIRKHLTHNKP